MLISRSEKDDKERYPWMDHEILKERLNKKLKMKNLSVVTAERRAGIGLGSLRNFLVGRTKSPTLETLNALSAVLDCSLPELLGVETEEPQLSAEGLMNLSLYAETVDTLIRLLGDTNLLLSAKEFFTAVKELYLFSSQKKKGIFDLEFAEWYLKNVAKPTPPS